MDVEPCEARSPPQHGSCYSRNLHRAVISAIRPEMYGIDRRVFICVVPEALYNPGPCSTVVYQYVFNVYSRGRVRTRY